MDNSRNRELYDRARALCMVARVYGVPLCQSESIRSLENRVMRAVMADALERCKVYQPLAHIPGMLGPRDIQA